MRNIYAQKVSKFICENFPNLPFSKRWLIGDEFKRLNPNAKNFLDFNENRVIFAVNILKKEGVLYEYEELATCDGELVAQFEDCVVFDENKNKCVITREK